MSDPPILLVGSTGSIGSALLPELARRGLRCRVLVRCTPEVFLREHRTLQADAFELVQGDLEDTSSLVAALAGIDRAFVVTAVGPNVVAQFRSFLAAARAASVRHVVRVSALGASEQSSCEIIRQHDECDRILEESGLGYTILRPNAFFQNLLWQADTVRASGQFYLPAGDAKLSMVDVRDVADVAARLLAAESPARAVYDLTGPTSLSFHDVAQALSAVVGGQVAYVPVAEVQARQAMLDAGMPAWHARAIAELQAHFRDDVYAPVTRDLPVLLGHGARDIVSFLRDHADAFRV